MLVETSAGPEELQNLVGALRVLDDREREAKRVAKTGMLREWMPTVSRFSNRAGGLKNFVTPVGLQQDSN